jgi:hypothetical protein
MTKKELIDALIATPLSDDTPVMVTYVGDDAEPGTDMHKVNVQIIDIINVDGRDGSETQEYEIAIEATHRHSYNSETFIL